MKTIALRFGEHFAPKCGTIVAHQEIIDRCGYVWYGKLGNTVSDKIVVSIMSADIPKVLLINSGKADRYWVHIAEIKKKTPDVDAIPVYYRENAEKFKTWFKVARFEKAASDVMSKCYVCSSGSILTEASKHSMSPYFIIECEEVS